MYVASFPFVPQTVSLLLDESTVSPATTEDSLELFGSVSRAVAIGAEAGEDIEEVSAGSVQLRVMSNNFYSEPPPPPPSVAVRLRSLVQFFGVDAGKEAIRVWPTTVSSFRLCEKASEVGWLCCWCSPSACRRQLSKTLGEFDPFPRHKHVQRRPVMSHLQKG